MGKIVYLWVGIKPYFREQGKGWSPEEVNMRAWTPRSRQSS